MPALVMAGGTPALRVLRARRSRCVICTSEKARQRASGRGVAPRLPGMNAGPKTACGGKRPLTGVVVVALFRPIPLWSAGILPALVMAGGTPALRVLRARRSCCVICPSEKGRQRASSHNLLPAIFSPRSSAPPGSRGRSANSCPAFSSRGRLTAADRFITGLGMRTKTALEPIPKVHLPPGTEQGKGTRIRIGLKDSSRF